MKQTSRKPSSKKSGMPVPAKITEDEALSALLRSGYLIESRTEDFLRKRGWYVEANSAYEDIDSQKSREIDIYALCYHRVGTDLKDRLFSSVLIECVNNPQPIAFITKEPYVRGWAVGQIKGVFDPEEVFVKGCRKAQNIGELLKIGSYHHYCRGRFASQFCSFSYKGDKKEWMAWHEDNHFNVFTALLKALEYRFTQIAWVPGTHISWEFINPVVLVQGDLLDVRCAGVTVNMKKVEHIKFHRTLIWNGVERGYMIDIVTERGFPPFIAMLEQELKRTASAVARHIRVLRGTLERKYPEAKATGTEQGADDPKAFNALQSGRATPEAASSTTSSAQLPHGVAPALATVATTQEGTPSRNADKSDEVRR